MKESWIMQVYVFIKAYQIVELGFSLLKTKSKTEQTLNNNLCGEMLGVKYTDVYF